MSANTMKPNRSLLKKAVHRSSPLRLSGVKERMFTSWFGGFFYNQIWEDPRVDMEALALDGESRVLTISSAGCNVLSYLTASPAEIVAVDLNPHHIFLTRLKLAALEHLPAYEDFFGFFGCADLAENVEKYHRYIREHLDEPTRRFWEGGSWMRRRVLGPRIKYFSKNLYNHARLGYFLRFVHGMAKVARRNPRALLEARNAEEQRAVYDQMVDPFFDHWLARAVGRVPFLLYGIGIPPRQFEALRKETNGQLLDLYRERVRKLACGYPLEDNYFTWQAFGRSYEREKRTALPEYLKEANYETIKRAVSCVRTEIETTTRYLEGRAENTMNRFVFLDSQDWMEPGQIRDQWAQIARVGQPGSRVIFRTASSVSPVEEALEPELRDRFDYEQEASRALFEKDRAAIYGGFHLYILKG
jgi:S-adenosylmethionine-diacylglycerol 3-amino-3-carboxypropyl transferase